MREGMTRARCKVGENFALLIHGTQPKGSRGSARMRRIAGAAAQIIPTASDLPPMTVPTYCFAETHPCEGKSHRRLRCEGNSLIKQYGYTSRRSKTCPMQCGPVLVKGKKVGSERLARRLPTSHELLTSATPFTGVFYYHLLRRKPTARLQWVFNNH